MRVATKGRYAVIAMVDLANYFASEQPSQTLASISSRQNVSLSYLEQLFAKLRQAGLVDSMRGPGGGYTLARTPNEISVGQIIMAVDGIMPEQQDQQLACHALWDTLHQEMLGYMNSVTLLSLLDPETAKKIAAGVKSGKKQFEQSPSIQPKKKTIKTSQGSAKPLAKVKKTPVVSSVFNWGQYLLKQKKAI
jgi:Rrf2 family transcriptional regulator, iron-sulfur cluster assembly transcription factor